jgi:F-type H+-transporting ATPase subunit b
MNLMLQQLGGLVLGSVPTMVLFLVTLAGYRLLVHAPLTKVLRERYARTQGAIEKATQAIAAAEAKTSEYEAKLRAARMHIFHRRQERLNAIHIESEQVLAEVSASAQQRSALAQIAIEQNMAAARLKLDASIDELAAEAIRSLLSASGKTPREHA